MTVVTFFTLSMALGINVAISPQVFTQALEMLAHVSMIAESLHLMLLIRDRKSTSE